MTLDLTIPEREGLVGMLVRVKFDDAEVLEPYFGSPLIASCLTKLVDSLIVDSRDLGGPGDLARAERWNGWREWSLRDFERGVVVRQAASLQAWDSWSVAQRSSYLRDCVAPFLPTDEELEAMESDVRALRKRND